MKQEEVLQALDEIIPYLQNKQKWTKEEALSMQVQTYRTYRIVAEQNGIHEATVKRMCERVINKFK